MNDNRSFEGKRVKLIFKDRYKVLIKEGVVLVANGEFVTLKMQDKTEIIPTQRVLRMELIK